MRKANKQTTGLLPQERFLNLLNHMVDIGWHPFGLYGRDYNFSHSDNPEFPYKLTYTKHDKEFHIDLSENMIFSNEAGLIEELLDNDMLDIHKFYNNLEPSIRTRYKKRPGDEDFQEEDSFTRSYFLQNQRDPLSTLDKLFIYIIEE